MGKDLNTENPSEIKEVMIPKGGKVLESCMAPPDDFESYSVVTSGKDVTMSCHIMAPPPPSPHHSRTSYEEIKSRRFTCEEPGASPRDVKGPMVDKSTGASMREFTCAKP